MKTRNDFTMWLDKFYYKPEHVKWYHNVFNESLHYLHGSPELIDGQWVWFLRLPGCTVGHIVLTNDKEHILELVIMDNDEYVKDFYNFPPDFEGQALNYMHMDHWRDGWVTEL